MSLIGHRRCCLSVYHICKRFHPSYVSYHKPSHSYTSPLTPFRSLATTTQSSTPPPSDKLSAAVDWVIKHQYDVKNNDWLDLLNELLKQQRFHDFLRVWQHWYSIQSFDMSRCQADPLRRSLILVSSLKCPTPPISPSQVIQRLNQWGFGHSSGAHDLMVETYLEIGDIKKAADWFDKLIASNLPRDARSRKVEDELKRQQALANQPN